MPKLVYADYAAATPTDSRVIKAMQPFYAESFANPSSIHSFGAQAATTMEKATESVAKFLNAKPSEIVFTSCGTESNNLAILGVAKANKHRGQHIIISTIEHPSITNACSNLEKDGWTVTYLPVDKNGLVNTNVLKKALKKETVLVSIHLANSEIGIIQNIAELSKITREAGVYFHTDACQAGAFLDLDIQKLGVDLLTFNGSKMYGPKGIAVLFVREGVDIFPILYGGGQQNSLRSGTENVPGIVGLARACEIATAERDNDVKKVGQLRDELQSYLNNHDIKINCAVPLLLPNHLSVTFENTSATNLVKAFDEQGIAVSSGSACSSKSLVDSHVLQAIGLTSDEIHKTVRISLGRQTTREEIQLILQAAQEIDSE